MNIKEFVNTVKSLEYLAHVELVRKIKSDRRHDEGYCSEADVDRLTDKAKRYKQSIRRGWFSEMSDREIIDSAKGYKADYGDLYRFIYCFYSDNFKNMIGLIDFTPEKANWYKEEANRFKAKLITE